MATVWEINQTAAKQTADDLIKRGLLEPVGNDRFWMHALLVAHARSLCKD
jgi:hypothetical protein